MSLNRYSAKRDANEGQIVRDLEMVGAKVERMSKPCDLAVQFRGAHYLMEVTNPENKYRKRSKEQLAVLAKMHIPMVSCSDEALRIIGAM
jgi:hypothetical protein